MKDHHNWDPDGWEFKTPAERQGEIRGSGGGCGAYLALLGLVYLLLRLVSCAGE